MVSEDQFDPESGMRHRESPKRQAGPDCLLIVYRYTLDRLARQRDSGTCLFAYSVPVHTLPHPSPRRPLTDCS